MLSDPNAPGVLGGDPRRTVEIDPYVAQQAELVTSGPVLERASEILGGELTTARLRDRLDVQGSPEVVSLLVSASAGDPPTAAAIANGVAEAYQLVVSERTAEDAQRAVEKLEENRVRLQQELDQVVAASAGSTEGASFQEESLSQRLSELRARMDQITAEAALAGSGVELFEPAVEPQEPSQPKPLLNALIGAAAGLVTAGVAAWWAAGRNRKVEDRQDPAPVLRAPLLGEVPKGFARPLAPGQPIPAPSTLGLAVEEAYNFVVGSIEHLLANRGGSSVVLTSAGSVHGDHKTLTAINMAVTALRDRRRVVLVDGDERTRRLSKLCGRENSPGFTDLFNEAVPVELCLHELALTDGSVLPVLPCGTELEHPAAFFRTAACRKALLRVAEQYDLVIIDTPPILTVSDTVALSQQADAVVLVVDKGTPLSRLRSVRDRLAFVGAPLIGYVYSRNPSMSASLFASVRGRRSQETY